MTRKSWVYVNGEPIPKEDYVPESVNAPMFMPDIKSFVSPIDGAVISSRSGKRAHMKRHDVVEVGNEYVKQKPIPSVPGLREAIERNYSR